MNGLGSSGSVDLTRAFCAAIATFVAIYGQPWVETDTANARGERGLASNMRRVCRYQAQRWVKFPGSGMPHDAGPP